MSLASWLRAIQLTWPAVLAAAALKYVERSKRTRDQTKRRRSDRRFMNLAIGNAIVELMKKKAGGETGWEALRSARENLLQCVVLAVRSRLDISDKEAIVASIVDFSTSETGQMRVVARSQSDRAVPKEYQSDRFVAWDAIHNAEPSVANDIRTDERWKQVGDRTYRSVVAVPITLNGKAYGALSIDSDIPYAFHGKRADVALEVQPYVAILALTYTEDSVSLGCAYDPSRYSTS